MALTEIDRGGRWLGLKAEAAVVAVVSMMEVKSNSYFVVVCFVQLSVEFELTYDNFDHFALPSAMTSLRPVTPALGLQLAGGKPPGPPGLRPRPFFSFFIILFPKISNT